MVEKTLNQEAAEYVPDEDDIHPWNGHSGTPQDKLATGCMWVVGLVFGYIALMAVIGGATELWQHFHG